MHRIVYRYHKHILALALALTLLSVFLCTRLRLNLDLFSLLPSNHPGTRSFLEVAEDIGFQSLLVAIVDVPEDLGEEKSRRFIDLLSERYASLPVIREVRCRVSTEKLAALFHRLMEYLPLLLAPEDLTRLSHKLSTRGIQEQILKNKALLMTPFGIAGKELVFRDPLGLREFWDTASSPGSRNPRMTSPGGYFSTEDGRTYFLFLEPTAPPQDVAFSKRLMTDIRRVQQEAERMLFKGEGSPAGRPEVAYAGGYPIAVSDEVATKNDIKITLLTSFLGVMILFGLTFRNLRILFQVGLPLAVSLLWTLGFAGLVFQRLNILTCVFSCVLIGLGVDFAIHIVNRFYGGLEGDATPRKRLEKTFRETGRGILVGGLTTAMAFFSIGISDFGGFRELGLMTGTGIVFCLIVMIFVLPSLLIYSSRKLKRGKRLRISGFGLKPLLNHLQKRSRPLVLVIFGAACFLSVLGFRVRFDDNLRNFRPADQKLFSLQDRVTTWLGGSAAEVLLIAQGSSEAEIMETGSDIYHALEELRISGDIAGIRTISRMFPSPTRQRRNLEYIRNHPGSFDMNRIKETFRQTLKENGFRWTTGYETYLAELDKAFASSKILLPSSIRDGDLEHLLKPFLLRKDTTFKIVTYLTPTKDLWSRAETASIKAKIIGKLEERGISGDRYLLTGANFLTSDLKALIIRNLKSSLWLAVSAILFVLLVSYRSLKFTLLSAIPLAVALPVLTGIMVLFDLEFNFFNLIVLPMIVGIGIDDGVHLTNTYLSNPGDGLSSALAGTGRAVVLTSLTTLVGFGSIALSHYPGLRSMGYVAGLGIGLCLLTSLFVLTPLLLFWGRSTTTPAASNGTEYDGEGE